MKRAPARRLNVARESTTARKARARAIARALARAYPDAWCALHYRTPWELLVATILSAQCTDAMVNQVTPALFAELPGIGRKTANVVLGTAFGKPAIFVDTHVRRLANRLGLTFEDDPDKIELDLQALLPPKEWTAFAHRLIHHGRRVCVARKPRCSACPVLRWCPQIRVTASA